MDEKLLSFIAQRLCLLREQSGDAIAEQYGLTLEQWHAAERGDLDSILMLIANGNRSPNTICLG